MSRSEIYCATRSTAAPVCSCARSKRGTLPGTLHKGDAASFSLSPPRKEGSWSLDARATATYKLTARCNSVLGAIRMIRPSYARILEQTHKHVFTHNRPARCSCASSGFWFRTADLDDLRSWRVFATEQRVGAKAPSFR